MYSNKSYLYGKKTYNELIDMLNEVIECGEFLLDEEKYYVDFTRDSAVYDDSWVAQDRMMLAMNKTSIFLDSDEAKKLPIESMIFLFKLYDRCRKISELYLNDLFDYNFRRHDD